VFASHAGHIYWSEVFPYWLLFAFFAAGAAGIRQRQSLRNWNPLLVAAGILTALMIGLRGGVGADWGNYQRIFEYTGLVDLDEALSMVDPAYALLNWAVITAGYGIWIVNLVCGAILVIGLLKFANRQPNPWLCILVAIPYLVIVVGMGYTRQAVALGFILWGLADLERKPIAKFVVLIICAAAFHKTAIVVLPLVAFATQRNRFIVFASFGAVGFLLFTYFFERAMGIITASYLDQEYDAAGATIRVAMNVVPALLFLAFSRRFQFEPTEHRLWRNFSIVALITAPMLFIATSSVIVDRLALYLIPLQLIIFGRLPWAFPVQGKPNRQIAISVLLYSATVQFVWLNYAGHAEYWLPYQLYSEHADYGDKFVNE
jgi:hypothetical protein